MILFSIAFFMGCSDDNKSDDSGDFQGSVDCSLLTVEECGNQSECSMITAQQMIRTEEGTLCIDWEAAMEDVGCTGHTSALTVETYAAPPDAPEDCWFFRDATIPEGWLDCESVIGECSS